MVSFLSSAGPYLGAFIQIGQPSTFKTVMRPMRRQLYAHPGEMGAAESFAKQQQLRLLQALPPDAQSRISVAATVCTDFDTFTYNQPAIVRMPGTHPTLAAWTSKSHVHISACGLSLWRRYAPEALRWHCLSLHGILA